MFWLEKLLKKVNRANDSLTSMGTGVYAQGRTEAYQEQLLLLNPEEYKVFMLLREGFLERECSQRLSMKRGDVRKYVRSIYNKLNVRNSAGLIVKYQYKNGVIL